jgi:hypothetical protein
MFNQLFSSPDSQNFPTNVYGQDLGDSPVDDRRPMDNSSEQYPAWRPSAIYDLAPFYAPSR